jgi:hypothetical protein
MLEKQNQVKQFRLGIIAPRTFNDITVLHELLAQKLSSISAIVTNNVVSGGEVVQAYARNLCIPLAVYPICPQAGGALISNARIIDDSDFIYILDDGKSHNSKNAQTECEKRQRKHKIVSFEPLPTKQAEVNKAKLLIEEKKAKMLADNVTTVDGAFLDKLLKVLSE